LKLCKDCKHCIPNTFWFGSFTSYEEATCAVVVDRRDMVAGRDTQELCKYARMMYDKCGDTAKFFEAK